MTPPTACRALKDWLLKGRKYGRNQRWLADTLGVKQPTVYRWISGENRPDTTYRLAIKYLTKGKVKVSMWFYPNEKQIAYGFRSEARRKEVGGGCV
jgi:hypothetical protein